MKVIDNFLSVSYHKELRDYMNSPYFEWHYNSNITNEDKESSLNEFGFFSMFYDENGLRESTISRFWYPGLLQTLDAVNGSKILRSRGDMTMYDPTNKVHDIHTDFDYPHISVVYYVNDSDGDTIFYDGSKVMGKIPENVKETNRVTPKANSLVMFDGSTLHTSTSPTKHKNRIIINSNFAK